MTYNQVFDAENRLISVTVNSQTTQFIYDGDGNMVKKIKPDGSKTIYVGGIYEVDRTSGTPGTVTRTVTYYPAAGGMRINITGGSNTLYYILKDHLGSASVVTDASGVTVGEQRYYPYGETRVTTGTIYTDKLYTGQRDTGLGIYDYGARFYSPKLGRFLSADTIGTSPANPQSWNRFSYVMNNPLKYTDPTGHKCVGEDEECINDDGSTGSGFTGHGAGGAGGGEGSGSCSGSGCHNHNKPHDPVDCNVQACIWQPNYWDLNPSHPDYYTLNGSWGFASFSFIIDRYGQAYWSGGLSLNTTILTGPGISFTGGHIGAPFLDSAGPLPTVNDISSFIAGVSGNVSAGAGPAGGLTFSPGSEVPNNFGTVSTIGFDAGVSSPFAGGSVMLTGHNQIPIVNQFANWFIGVAKSVLP